MPAELVVTRIGHSCHVVEIGTTRVLTDPWFTTSATYFHGEPVAATVAELGRIDAVLVTHEHYDHCDLDALVDGGFDVSVPLIGPGTVTAIATDKGFGDVRTIEAWESTQVGDLRVTATPGEHGVHEVTFVLQAGDRTVFFGGDSLYVPELDDVPARFGRVDLALLPTNGLCLRFLEMRQVVMNAREAARLAAVLAPAVAIPHHYAFHSGWLGDRMITRGDTDPRHFADALAEIAPDITVRLVVPGTPVRVP